MVCYTENIVISLKHRLTMTYTLFVSVALLVLTLIINRFTGALFEELVKETITERSADMLRSVAEQYNPLTGGFDLITLEAMGMHFVHEGYVISVTDTTGDTLWDARSMDMQHCVAVLNEIALRMEAYHPLNGSLQDKTYPIDYAGNAIGALTIQSYGPFFYSEGEERFLTSLNRLLLIAGLVFAGLSAIISLILAAAIASPILKASEAANLIAAGNRAVRIPDAYHTRELHALSRSINELAEELTEAERRQKQLTADVAHELRTPLTCIQGTIEALLDGVWEPTTERLEGCYEEIIRLSKLVHDLSLLTNLEWKDITLSKTRFDLAKLLSGVAAPFAYAAREKGIALQLRLSPTYIRADYDRIKQVFINLLSNALRYTDSGSIVISIVAAPVGVTVTIADTGIGIDEAELPRIFERFYRSDKSRSRGTGGAGIGLTIAAAIVAAHSGRLSVESAVGHGSVFHVALPETARVEA
jgi:signal transduction histidine kinase